MKHSKQAEVKVRNLSVLSSSRVKMFHIMISTSHVFISSFDKFHTVVKEALWTLGSWFRLKKCTKILKEQKQNPEEDSCRSSCCHPELSKASLSCNCFSLQFFRFLEGSRAASIVLRSGLWGGQSTPCFLLHQQCVWIVTFLKNEAAPSQMFCTWWFKIN